MANHVTSSPATWRVISKTLFLLLNSKLCSCELPFADIEIVQHLCRCQCPRLPMFPESVRITSILIWSSVESARTIEVRWFARIASLECEWTVVIRKISVERARSTFFLKKTSCHSYMLSYVQLRWMSKLGFCWCRSHARRSGAFVDVAVRLL